MITVNTKPAIEGYKMFYRRRKIAVIFLAFEVLLMIYMTITAFMLLFYYLSTGRYFGLLAMLVCVVALNASAVSRSLNSYKDQFNSMVQTYPGLAHRFTFSPESLIIDETAEGHSVKLTVTYDHVKNAIYKNGWFVMYIDGGTGCVFNQNDINGDPDALKIMLRNGLGRKFKESR